MQPVDIGRRSATVNLKEPYFPQANPPEVKLIKVESYHRSLQRFLF